MPWQTGGTQIRSPPTSDCRGDPKEGLVALTPSEVATLERLLRVHETGNWNDELMLRYYLGRQRVEQLGMAIPPAMPASRSPARWL